MRFEPARKKEVNPELRSRVERHMAGITLSIHGMSDICEPCDLRVVTNPLAIQSDLSPKFCNASVVRWSLNPSAQIITYDQLTRLSELNFPDLDLFRS